VLAIAGTVFIRGIYGFLASQHPLPGGILLVEGWSSDYVIEAAVDEFHRNHYDAICLAGGPIEWGHALREQKTFADYAKATLLKMGLPAEVLHSVPAPAVERDRSYTSALSLRKWLKDRGAVGAKVNIIGNGPHSRRTWLLYEKALKGVAEVGIIGIAEADFEPHRWWASSEGFRTVTGELIGYVYARLLFFPPPPQP